MNRMKRLISIATSILIAVVLSALPNELSMVAGHFLFSMGVMVK